MKPVIVLVGRANVGKSTLFNRMTQSREAIVADYAGLTRDRHYGSGQYGEFAFIVIDTGGFEPGASEGIYRAMAQQTQQAIAEADAVVFLVDARAGLNAHDHDIANYLRRLGKAVVLCANKAEGMRERAELMDFYALGFPGVHPISAAHGQGVHALVETIAQKLPQEEGAQAGDAGAASGAIRLAVCGRPNVGKSTLVNTWLGEERMVVYDMPGTTRDAISVAFEYAGQPYMLIDTAGLRRKGRVFETVEKFSVVKTLQAIESANVVLLLLDAVQGVTDQDAHIAGFVLQSGRAVVVAVNKWDAVDAYARACLQRSIETRLGFLRFANLHLISARRRQGLKPLWSSIRGAYEAANRKMATAQLTRILHEAVQFQQPRRVGMFRPKLKYAHQGGMNPPVVVVHGNALEGVSDAYKRYLEGRFRAHFDLIGTPLRVQMKNAVNPYVAQ